MYEQQQYEHDCPLHVLCVFPLHLGPPGEFIPSEDTVLGFYRQASIHSFTDEDYGFAKAVSCLRLISIFKVLASNR